jgi:hypothetical protein
MILFRRLPMPPLAAQIGTERFRAKVVFEMRHERRDPPIKRRFHPLKQMLADYRDLGIMRR